MWQEQSNRPLTISHTPAAGDFDFLERLRNSPPESLNARLNSLTAQERTILDCIVRGLCNKEICRNLDIELTTAKAHTSHIFKKLGVKNRVQAAVLRLWAILLADEATPIARQGKQSAATNQ
jgi:DNA-binding NarL/FixJ family response regulator